ncbi:MAG: hypothetical protein A3F78_05765 [Burkholderiales bacterium RIFCSPLOWO2_12_FULL_61_40]|nr:MAG: hypothetical protein A3F78_05765 [Burkholderiales bacterium RIFCSPLOWO2_12_FULL_61_40]
MPVLHRLSLAQKFLILGAMALLMTVLPTGLYLSVALPEIGMARLEARGGRPLMALQKVVQLTQQHRGIAAGMLGGNEVLALRRPDTRDALNQAIVKLDDSLKAAGASARTIAQWNEHKRRWSTLEQSVADRKLNSAESSAQHTQLIAQLLELNSDVLDEFSLTYDARPDSYALILAAFSEAPSLAERLGQLRAQGTGFLALKSLPLEKRGSLSATQARANELFSDMLRNLNKANSANPALKKAMASKVQTLQTQVVLTLAMVDQNLINARELSMPANVYFQDFTDTIDAVYTFNGVALHAVTALLDQRARELRRNSILVLGLLLTLWASVVMLSLAFVRSITGPVHEALEVAHAASEGDLTAPIPVRGSNEIGQLMRALANMKNKLTPIVAAVRNNAISVANDSTAIAQGSLEQSRRIEQQSAALEEVAASIHELDSAVKNNAHNAQQANQHAQAAAKVAIVGGEVVQQMIFTMQGIHTGSQQIAEILNVINGIAFQTNILALNAAVEAARAGEQGRGFAVVASEVRILAQRSAGASKEIKRLITTSVERVEEGLALVEQTGVTVAEIVTAIQRVADYMGDISAASEEQSTSVAQVSEAVSHIDKATQENAALVEESAAAADSLQHQAQHLVQSVAVFTLDEDHRQGAPTRAAVPLRPSSRGLGREPERRGLHRAQNVSRIQPSLSAKVQSARVAAAKPLPPHNTDEQWTTF